MDITLMRNGEIVTATVKQVIPVLFHIYSRVQKSIENWSVWSEMDLGEVGVPLP